MGRQGPGVLAGVQALLTSMLLCWREKTLSMRRLEAKKRVEEETSRPD